MKLGFYVAACLVLCCLVASGCKSAAEKRKELVTQHLTAASEKHASGDLQGAMAEVNAALEAEPDSQHALVRRGSIRAELKDYEGAQRDFDRVLELNPQNPAAYVGRAMLHKDQKQYSEAIADLDKAIELQPDLAAAWMARGDVYASAYDFKKAIDDFSKAIELDSTLYRAYMLRAYALMALNQTERAAADLRYVRENSKDPLMIRLANERLAELGSQPTR